MVFPVPTFLVLKIARGVPDTVSNVSPFTKPE